MKINDIVRARIIKMHDGGLDNMEISIRTLVPVEQIQRIMEVEARRRRTERKKSLDTAMEKAAELGMSYGEYMAQSRNTENSEEPHGNGSGDDWEYVAETYKQTHSIKETAKITHHSSDTVANILNSMGVERKRGHRASEVTEEFKAEVIKAYAELGNIQKVAQKCKCNQQKVTRILDELCVPRNKKGKKSPDTVGAVTEEKKGICMNNSNDIITENPELVKAVERIGQLEKDKAELNDIVNMQFDEIKKLEEHTPAQLPRYVREALKDKLDEIKSAIEDLEIKAGQIIAFLGGEE